MRLAVAFGRLYSRVRTPGSICLGPIPTPLRASPRSAFSTFVSRPIARPRSRQWSWRAPRGGRVILMAAGNGALATAAFVQIAEEDNTGTEKTSETRMLEVSRDEIKKVLNDDDTGLTRLRHRIVLFLDLYIWEPICTGARFLQLAVIFVPVLLAVPIMWIGRRHPDRDNERTGTLLWYKFLVKAMEWAGPSFIKVDITLRLWCDDPQGLTCDASSLANGPPRGRTSFQMRCAT